MDKYPVLPSSYGSFKISECHYLKVLPKKVKGIVIACIFDSKQDEGLISKRYKSVSKAMKFLAKEIKKFRKDGFKPIARLYTEHGYVYSNCNYLNVEDNAYYEKMRAKIGLKYKAQESDKPGIPYWAERGVK